MKLSEAVAKIQEDSWKEYYKHQELGTEPVATTIEEAIYGTDHLLRQAGFPVVDIKWYTEASINPMIAWCEENIGSMLYTHIHGSRWGFENERDAVLFTLRWL